MNLSILRNVGVLASGAVVAQAIGLLTLPILTRLYSAEAFGHYQLYLGATALFAVIPTLRLDVAMLRADEDRDLAALLDLNFLLTLGFGALLMVGAFVWTTFAPRAGSAGLGFSPYLLAPALIITSLYQYLSQFTVRERAFSLMSTGKIVQACVFAGVGILIGVWTGDGLGVLTADLCGKVIAVIAACLVFRRVTLSLYNRESWRGLGRTLMKFREYPLVSWPGSLVSVVAAFLTPTLIYGAFSAADAGQYAMADRALTLPVAFVVSAVSQAYSADLAQNLRSGAGDAHRSFRNMIKTMVLLGLVPTVIVVLFAPILFQVVFGPTWEMAGRIARIMIIPAYSFLIYGSINMVLILVGAQKLQTAWEFARLVLIAGLWVTAARLHLSLMTIVICHAVIMTLLSLSFIVMSDRLLAGRGRLSLATPARGD